MREQYDVVVVGAGIAGCTAATLSARQGLRVALLEAHSDPKHYKRMCTHYIQAHALPTMQRLGIADRLDGVGAVHNHGSMWTKYGWFDEDLSSPRPLFGYNVRRSTLDPMLRGLADEEPTLDLLAGAKVIDLVRTDGRVTGVVVRTASGEQTLGAHLVVGADGKSSVVAERAGLVGTESPNARFAYFAGFRGVDLGSRTGMLWLDGLDMAYAFTNDDGVTVLAVMPLKDKLPQYDDDREAAIRAAFASLADAPDLTRAERVTDVVGTRDYPNLRRKHVSAPGLALVGDAAQIGDPVWGIGCGFAFESAAMLVDSVAGAVTAPRSLDAALARYDKKHHRRFDVHHKSISDFSTGRPLNRLEQWLYSGAVKDPAVRDLMIRLGTRTASPLAALRPDLVARAWWRGRSVRAAVPSARVNVPEQRPPVAPQESARESVGDR